MRALDVFRLRNQVVSDYAEYTESFVAIRDAGIRARVDEDLASGLLWPEPLVQLNPAFEPGGSVDELVSEGLLDSRCSELFRIDGEGGRGPLRFHRHQREAIEIARTGANYVLTTGTGSGKSMAYIVPIVDHVLRRGSGKGIQAIVVYPMNALANSQFGELEKFLGPVGARPPVTFRRYTGQEDEDQRQAIIASPPDILLTNYVMLELMLTRPREAQLIQQASGLRFLVFDELHTYRGRQGADVALLSRRVRDACRATQLQYVGTSATLAGAGSYEEQRFDVAALASRLFGAAVRPESVVGETLRRATTPLDTDDAASLAALSTRIAESSPPPASYQEFVDDPVASWIEQTVGLQTERLTERLVRARPRALSGERGLGALLSATTGEAIEACERAIERTLLAGYSVQSTQGFPAFAFRLHQFFSRGETVYASLGLASERHVQTEKQAFVPGDRSRVLLPLAFCRECGQDYYPVRVRGDGLVERELRDIGSEEDAEDGYLFIDLEEAWPEDDPVALAGRVPADWQDQAASQPRVLRDRRKYLPRRVHVAGDGSLDGDLEAWFMPAPFRFCANCGATYAGRGNEFGKLGTLGTGGRSSATTVLSVSTLAGLRSDGSLDTRAEKLLSFSDNRQDASLQAGHLNDFVEVTRLRSALYYATVTAGTDGLAHEHLTDAVFRSLLLSPDEYALNPTARFGAAEDRDRALRDVLGYRLYRDLERGWRLNAPNLEQTGLLHIRYRSLDEVAADEDTWSGAPDHLRMATTEERADAATVLLDVLRRGLAIRVGYLNQADLEKVVQNSSQHLIAPWAIDENEPLTYAAVALPRPRRADDTRETLHVSARGGFGQFLRRPTTFPGRAKPALEETDRIIRALFDGLVVAGLLVIVQEPRSDGDAGGYQLAASQMRWCRGDGTRAARDPMRMPQRPDEGGVPNRFFVNAYTTGADRLRDIRAREHTAQVRPEDREEREEAFREARLPILYCSPTMELGVDISELNAVNMRNVPPTPANYAQRSGRAGRSGQPALVTVYCAAGNSHDQYYFRQPELMVAGQVSPPRLDLANEDLVRAHVHAVWLAETRVSLGNSLRDVLDVAGDSPSLELLDKFPSAFGDPAVEARARIRAQTMLASVPDLLEAEWFGEDWLAEALRGAPLAFDRTCDRWRGLYRAAAATRDLQTRIANDASRPARERDRARSERRLAEAQIDLLIAGTGERLMQSDFYSYRYFASEGFLPGYSFPRLPLAAFIPGRRAGRGREEYVQRPRFLAISEFGPRSVIYHEGARYLINKVILPVGETSGDEGRNVITSAAKQCSVCGYVHVVEADRAGPDVCERPGCGTALGAPIGDLLRLQNVVTRRRDRINSDEEERQRIGFEIRTGVRFADGALGPAASAASVTHDDQPIANLAYGGAATVWRINAGWRRRKDPHQLGFILDTERGYWAKNELETADDPDDPLSNARRRVVPYVEDRKNSLLFQPADALSPSEMASLAAALRRAIQVEYQLEESELAAEPLPSEGDRRLILFFEAAEGGAGVLRRLVEESDALPRVARRALELCHYDPFTMEDQGQALGARERCEAACYDCLMSYTNQRDHRLLDRAALQPILQRISASTVNVSPRPISRAEHLARLMRQCGSNLERVWLSLLDRHGYRLPTDAQKLLADHGVQPDFYYANGDPPTAIFIDGPPHDDQHQKSKDEETDERLREAGYRVVRFHHSGAAAGHAEWLTEIQSRSGLFGKGNAS